MPIQQHTTTFTRGWSFLHYNTPQNLSQIANIVSSWYQNVVKFRFWSKRKSPKLLQINGLGDFSEVPSGIKIPNKNEGICLRNFRSCLIFNLF